MVEKAMGILEQAENYLGQLGMQQAYPVQQAQNALREAYNQATLANIKSQNAAVQKMMSQDRHRFDPNKREAFQIPLSQLVTMWQVKHGDKWFDGSEPKQEGEDFYADAFMRLRQNELFEMVDGWVRLKENVEKLLADR